MSRARSAFRLAAGAILGLHLLASGGEWTAGWDHPAGASSGFTRVRLVHKRWAKYPIERIEESVTRRPGGERESVTGSRRMVGDHVLVTLQPQAGVADLRALCRRLKTRIRRRLRTAGVYLVETPRTRPGALPALLARLRSETDVVRYAEPDWLLRLDDTTPNDPQYGSGNLWGLEKIECPKAWDFHTGSGRVVVAVIDTGVDWSHPDLAANVWRNPGETGIDSNGLDRATNNVDDDANGYVDDVHGWDFRNDDNAPMDGNSHGTRCSGHIGAIGNNARGVVGVSWNVKLMPIKLYSDGGDATTSDAIDCFHYATMMRTNGHNLRVINASWGEKEFSQGLYEAVSNSGVAGILCSASAGNDNHDLDSDPQYPAGFDLANVIAVAATTETDARRSSSNYGATSVDLGAPGQNILSTTLNGGYEYSHGTSRSAPLVAGTAALLWDMVPSLSLREVKAAILNGTDPVSSLEGITVTGGRLNAYRAALGVRSRITRMSFLGAMNGTNVVLEWPGATGHTYTLQWRSNLLSGAWTDLTGGLPSATVMNAVTVNVDGAAERFYRVTVSCP